jgi:type II secretory pathway component GspD/PulD (secretin)
VAEVIRDTYSGRIASTAKERSAAAASQKSNQQPRRTGDQNQADSGSNASSPAIVASAGDEDKMTLAVDVQGNSIVVTAPSQLAQEVEKLAQAIDKESEQTVQVLPLHSAQMLHLQESLKNLYGGQVQTGPAKTKAKATR